MLVFGKRALGALLVALFLHPGSAPADEASAVGEILAILQREGMIDEAQAQRIRTKYEAERAQPAPSVAAGVLEGVEWSGDLRLRHEALWYDSDSLGNERDNRYRFRYRARFGFTKQVNDWAKVGLRLSSGAGESRSRNRTLGDDEDFDPDELFIDRAWAEIALPRAGSIDTKLFFGKLANPYRWKHGKDYLIWDADITLEGGYLKSTLPLAEGTRLWATLGAFIADENSTSSDPKVLALQLGGQTKLSEALETGARVSAYEWRSLDARFIDAALDQGNLVSAFDTRARIGEASAFLRIGSRGNWPLLLYGNYVRNLSADSAVIGGVPVDEEDTAWGIGFEAGSAKRLFKLGVGYFRVEANSTIGQIWDSDLLDGTTNREGFAIYGARALGPHAELRFTFYDGEEIRTRASGGGNGPFEESLGDADRKRLQSDIVFTF